MRAFLTMLLVALSLSACSGKKAKEAFDHFVSLQAFVDSRFPSDVELLRKQGALGEDGAAFQAQVKALADRRIALREREQAAQTRAAAGVANAKPDEVLAATAELEAIGKDADTLRSEIDALMSQLEKAVADVPDSVKLADVTALSVSKLERIFARAGWKRPDGTAVSTVKSSGFAYENFDLAKDKGLLNVFIARPCTECGVGEGGATPAQVAMRAKEQGKVFTFDEKSNVYVELTPKADVSDAQARELLDAVFKKE
ncbi:MAG: hypothetical protein ACO1OB_05850 [Archangium sp.]